MITDKKEIKVALIGNPNVGKSSIFNALTGLHQHTGNWAGKTVENAMGKFKSGKCSYTLIDLPGTYSLDSNIAEEKIACDELRSLKCDIVAVICDSSRLERSLVLVQKAIDYYDNVLVILNLIDEAKKRKITIDKKELTHQLGVDVITVSAKDKYCKKIITEKLDEMSDDLKISDTNKDTIIKETQEYILNAKRIYDISVSTKNAYSKRDLLIDNIITNKTFAFLIMLIFILIIFWLTITGANYPSQLISSGFAYLGEKLSKLLGYINTPSFIKGVIIDGIFRVLSWVISVMLPPMAIFFPLFTLLEDAGYLPRIAYNVDKPFCVCGTCGKQSLTMCMGIGCNAVGVCGARIIGSKRDRIIAIVTNTFMPCNGRFPAIITIISIFLVSHSQNATTNIACALILTLFILLSILITMAVSCFLSKTILSGNASSYALELPPYRIPQISKTIIRSVFDKTIVVLLRAVCIAAPAGFVIYVISNVKISNISILYILSDILSPIGKFIGLDGAILLAFILGMPANEIVLPILLMIYLAEGRLLEFSDISQLKNVLVNNGWDLLTAINFITFSIFHFPCTTTLISIYKETKSKIWTIIAFILPTVIGLILCFVNKLMFLLFT